MHVSYFFEGQNVNAVCSEIVTKLEFKFKLITSFLEQKKLETTKVIHSFNDNRKSQLMECVCGWEVVVCWCVCRLIVGQK